MKIRLFKEEVESIAKRMRKEKETCLEFEVKQFPDNSDMVYIKEEVK